MNSEGINAILLIVNLLAVFFLFRLMGRQGGKGISAGTLGEGENCPCGRAWKGTEGTALRNPEGESRREQAAARLRAAGWMLEFSVYGAGMIRMADLILQGIAEPGSRDRTLFAVRLLLAESMLFLFPLRRILNDDEREEGQGKAGSFLLTMLLLLGLTLRGWRETDQVRAFACQAVYLVLFFGFEFLEERQRRRGQKHADCRNREVSYFAGEEDAMEGRYRQRQEEYLENMEQQYQRTRELWHDLKNHIRVLEILAEEGRFGELTDYLGSFKRDVEYRMIPLRTGCAAVDALLGDKLYRAGRQEVEMSLQLCDLSRMRIREVDLCVILGNLLDNALEACAGLAVCQREHPSAVQPVERRIGLRMRQEEDFYYITVVNTAEEPRREGDTYLSGKRDRDNGVGHGLGLRSAERTAHRYGGLLAAEYSDGEFRVTVRLQVDSPGGL